MKYILPMMGAIGATALFAFSSTGLMAGAVERPSHQQTFRQLELFADVLSRVRNEYVEEVEDSELIDDALNGMLQSLDPHSSYMSPDSFRDMQSSSRGEYGGLGMEVTTEEGFVKVIAPIDDTPAKRAGVKAGDYITEIEGESIMGVSLNDAVSRMRGKPGEPITITIAREDEEQMEITIVREVIKRKGASYEVKDGIGYIRIPQFNDKADTGLINALDGLKKEMGGKIPGIVLDLRGNPGGQRGELAKGIPLVVLIDGASASASEIVAGAVQDRGRGLVVGMTSFGKGSVQSVIPLRGGRDGALRLTTQRYYTPSGRSIQGTGIDPDIYISAVPDDGKERKIRREADLRNTIPNENAEEGSEETEEEAEAVEIKIDYPPEGFEIEDDYQLQKAIEILKNGTYPNLLAKAG